MSKSNPEIESTQVVARFVRDERGASFIEYVIVCGLVAIAAIGAFTQFGTAVQTRINTERQAIETMP
jgi:Flp pilus assembly pilin Flp